MCFCSAACFFVSQTLSNSIHDLVFCLPKDMERGLPPQQDPPGIRNVRYVKSQCEARAGAKSPSAITLYLHTFRLAYDSRPQTPRSRCPSCEKENSSGFENVSIHPNRIKTRLNLCGGEMGVERSISFPTPLLSVSLLSCS